MYASRTTQFIVGIFGLVGIAALSVLAFTLGRIPLVAAPHYMLYAMFDNVSGLQMNEGIMVDEDAIASIKTSGIIGDKYVAISIGGGDPLKPGATIAHTESSFVLEDAIGQLVNGGGSKSTSAAGAI